MAFEPRPSFNPWNRQQQIATALDTPFTFGQGLSENFQQGILDTFGLGTTLRDLASGGNAARPSRTYGTATPIGAAVEGVYGARDLLFPDTSKRLDKAAYEASPWYRDDIPWDASFTEDRAASLAAMRDKKKLRDSFNDKSRWDGPFGMRMPGLAEFAGGFAGQMFDPVNYVPVFGEAVQAAAVAKFGSIAGRMMVSASDAAINTAAFGVLTSNIRKQFGDDVSWQAITSDIAMGALIGGAFGAGVGAIARGADRRKLAMERARPRLETLGNTMQARTVLDDAVTGLVDRGEVRLTERSMVVADKLADEVTAATTSQKALREQTAGIAGTKAGEVVISPSGARVAVKPELVEAKSLTHATGALQVRDRSSAQSAAQVEQIATSLDPARLMPNVDGAQGAPLVGADGVIDSGNGRVMAINRAYDAYPEKAQAYRQALVEAGYAEAATMERPILVQRRLTDLSPEARSQFNAELNGPTTARMSAVELAALDRTALDESVMDALDPESPIAAASNRAFVGRFLARLPANERGALVDGVGNLSADGQRRIENALVAAAYGDADAGVLRRFAEATDDNTRAIVGALSDAAGKWARMRQAVKRGEISPDYDLTDELTQAVRLVGQWREQAGREGRPVGKVISEGLAQLDLLSGEVSPEAQTFIRMFYTSDEFTRAVGRETLAARLDQVIKATEELGRPSLFGDALMPTKGEVLTNAQRIEADLFAADGLEPRAQALGEGREGSAAGEAGATDRPSAAAGDAASLEQQAEIASTSTDAKASLFPPDVVTGHVAETKGFYESQPERSLDDTYAVIPALQDELHAVGSKLAIEYDAAWKNPGLKKKETAAEKMVRKGYKSTKRLTDLVRGGFLVKSAADADAIIGRLREHFDVLDEGWVMTAANYFDRKAMIRFDDGTIGEVQFWHPDLFDAKGKGGGHAMYEEWRKLPKDDPRSDELFAAQRALYEAVLPVDDPAWSSVVNGLLGRSSTPGNAARSAASLMGRPESMISAGWASDQASSPSFTNQPVDPTITAGRASQLKNAGLANRAIGETPSQSIDRTEPAPDPVPDGLAEAAARVGTGETLQQMAESHGVMPDGSFAEEADIEQLRSTGALSPEDEAELLAAQQAYDNAQAYADTLAVAARCVIG